MNLVAAHDSAGRLLNVIYPDGYGITNNFNRLSQITNRIDSAKITVTNWFNNQGLVSAVSNAFGQVRKTLFDLRDRAATNTDANAVTVSMTFDDLDRVRTRKYPDGGIEKFGYSPKGLTAYTNQLGNVTRYVYDAGLRKTFETNANLEITAFRYDPSGNLTNLIDGKSQNTFWLYDQFGRVTVKKDHLGTNAFTYAYDADDRLTNRTSAAKGPATYKYDPAGDLTNVIYQVSSNLVFAYDPLNRLTNMITSGIFTNSYSYDAVGQLLSEDGPWPDDTVSYTYANRTRVGLRFRQPNASDWVQSYAYDAARRLTSVTSPAGPFAYDYDVDRHVLVGSVLLPNGASIVNSYDSKAHIEGTSLWASGASLDDHVYYYDGADRRTQHYFEEGNHVDFSYDQIGQLTGASGLESDEETLRSHEQFKYSYDKAGNLSNRVSNLLTNYFNVNSLNELTTQTNGGTLTVAGTTTSEATSVTVSGTGLSSGPAYLYSDNTWARPGANFTSGNNTYTATAADSYGRSSSDTVSVNLPATNSFVYDSNGNLVTNGTRSFAYDDENQLISITEPSAWRSEFRYDGKMRRRVRKEFTWSSGSWLQTNEVHYVYDGNLVIQERWFNTNLSTAIPAQTVTYTRGLDLSGNSWVAGLPRQSEAAAGGIGGLLARTESSTLNTSSPQLAHAYYHCDGNGNITCLINTNQIIVAKYLYDPFGNILSLSGSLAEANLYRFSTEESHTVSSLVGYLYRLYSPSLQRWLNKDPIWELGFHELARRAGASRGSAGPNLYTMVRNAPISATDPFGLSLWACTSRAFGIIGMNHAYIWDDRENPANGYHDCSMQSSSGNRGGGSEATHDKNATGPAPVSGPGWDIWYGDDGATCTRVPDSDGKEPAAMKCCREKANNGIWVPGHDCHNPVDKCLKEAGIDPDDIPRHPRFGKNNGVE